MKNVIILLIVLVWMTGAIAQSCLPEGIIFTTQVQIDNFQMNYPGCTEIEGYVLILGYDITNLYGLNVVTSIGDSLVIENTDALTSLTGLEKLTYIGGDFLIKQNNGLTSLIGLEGLTSIGSNLGLYTNIALASLDGLEELTSIGGDLRIGYGAGNSALTSLTGLEGLTSISGNLLISDNYTLSSLIGLEGLIYIGGNLLIGNYTTGNPALTTLTGLEGLTSIGGDLSIRFNNVLISIADLIGLTSIGGILYIKNNDALNNLIGLDSIQASSITNLLIFNNSNLEECDVYSICQYLTAPNGTVEIHDNAPGCNSQAEVEETCFNSVEEIKTRNGITIIPNPSIDKITFSSTSITGNTQLIIFDIRGEKVIKIQLTDTQTQIDISALPRGVYFVMVQNEEMVEIGKMVKE